MAEHCFPMCHCYPVCVIVILCVSLLSWVTLLLSVTYKHFMFSVIELNVVMLSVVIEVSWRPHKLTLKLFLNQFSLNPLTYLKSWNFRDGHLSEVGLNSAHFTRIWYFWHHQKSLRQVCWMPRSDLSPTTRCDLIKRHHFSEFGQS